MGGKWANPFWQVWDLLLLWLAMLHGANGIRVIIDDYAEKDRLRVWLKVILFAACAIVLLVGTLTITAFRPLPPPAQRLRLLPASALGTLTATYPGKRKHLKHRRTHHAGT